MHIPPLRPIFAGAFGLNRPKFPGKFVYCHRDNGKTPLCIYFC
jgi:hypothetical protein